MKRFCVIAMREKQEILQAASKIKNYLEEQGCTCFLNAGYVKRKNISGDIQCAIVLGGDGTLLQAARELAQTKIRLIGVNFGKLGFLAEVEKDDIVKTLDCLIHDEFTIEKRMLLNGRVVRNGTIIMENSRNYHDEQNNINTIKMREVLAALPSFCKQFFRGIQEYTSSRTRLAYAYDIRVFFEFLHTNNSVCAKMEIEDFPLSILDQITREDIEEYMDFITYYIKDGREYTNNERGKKRKLSALKVFIITISVLNLSKPIPQHWYHSLNNMKRKLSGWTRTRWQFSWIRSKRGKILPRASLNTIQKQKSATLHF